MDDPFSKYFGAEDQQNFIDLTAAEDQIDQSENLKLESQKLPSTEELDSPQNITHHDHGLSEQEQYYQTHVPAYEYEKDQSYYDPNAVVDEEYNYGDEYYDYGGESKSKDYSDQLEREIVGDFQNQNGYDENALSMQNEAGLDNSSLEILTVEQPADENMESSSNDVTMINQRSESVHPQEKKDSRTENSKYFNANEENVHKLDESNVEETCSKTAVHTESRTENGTATPSLPILDQKTVQDLYDEAKLLKNSIDSEKLSLLKQIQDLQQAKFNFSENETLTIEEKIMLSNNGFFIDSIPSMAVETSLKLRRLIEEREEEAIKLQEIVSRMRQLLISQSELHKPAANKFDLDREYMYLRIENEKLKQQETEDLSSIIKRNELEHNLIKEQQDLLLSNLRLSIEELTQAARPMEEQRILVQSLRETISGLAEENDRLRAAIK